MTKNWRDEVKRQGRSPDASVIGEQRSLCSVSRILGADFSCEGFNAAHGPIKEGLLAL